MSISSTSIDSTSGNIRPIVGSEAIGINSVEDDWGEAPIVIRFRPVIPMDADQFFEFASQNQDLHIEQNANGDVVVMSPAGANSSNRNFKICVQLGRWAESNNLGLFFDSSAGFRLPNKSCHAPDASWIKKERWEAIPVQEQEKFPLICPDFVIELRSPSDRLKNLQEKMDEYIANGVQLGWLIDPYNKKVHVYRPNANVEILQQPTSVSGEPVLAGFVLQLAEIFA